MPRYTAVLVVFCSLLSNSLLRARCASQGAQHGTYSLGRGLEPGLKLSILPTPSHDAHVYAVPSGGVLRRASGRSVDSPREVGDIRVVLGLALLPRAGRRKEASADVCRGSYVDQLFDTVEKQSRRTLVLPRSNADRACRIGGGKTAGRRKSRSGTAVDAAMYLSTINIMRRIKLPPILVLLLLLLLLLPLLKKFGREHLSISIPAQCSSPLLYPETATGSTKYRCSRGQQQVALVLL